MESLVYIIKEINAMNNCHMHVLLSLHLQPKTAVRGSRGQENRVHKCGHIVLH